ncbi:MAG: radical SAM protein, partial [Desulfobacterales bacterium]
MKKKTRQGPGDPVAAEVGTIRKNGPHRLRVVLVYPNYYAVGMSNLGFQVVYRLLNGLEGVVCERAFLPDEPAPTAMRPTSVETGRPLTDFDIIAFSVSFENDYPNILDVLTAAGLPLPSRERQDAHPLVMAGGVACWLNPEPLARFIDCFLIGEAEAMLAAFIECLQENGFPARRDRRPLLAACARQVEGVYVPQFYRPVYGGSGTLATIEVLADVPAVIKRPYLADLSRTPACSAVITPHTTFESTFLIEVGRGCPHGCRFCSAGFTYRPPRFRPPSLLQACLRQGAALTDRIGLVGAAVSDLPGLKELCRQAEADKVRISFSSLRADALDEGLVAALARNRVKTATIAPEAGSERMRRVINKGIDEDAILRAAALLVAGGIPNLKLYFMIGLPTETADDIAAIVGLCQRIKHVFLSHSRGRKRIGEITVGLSCFVPKPATPFQWAAMDDTTALKEKIRTVKQGLRKVPNVRVHADVPRWAYIQALLSRGDRRVAGLLELAYRYRQNWPQSLKETPLNADFYVLRPRAVDEVLPWDFIDHGVKKSFLIREYRRALDGRPTPACPMDDCRRCG